MTKTDQLSRDQGLQNPASHFIIPLRTMQAWHDQANQPIHAHRYLIAGVCKRYGEHYVDTQNIKNSPGGTFLWVKTFNIG